MPGHGIYTTEMGTPEQMIQEQETMQKNLKSYSESTECCFCMNC